ncbi:MAG: hypothetical protein V2A58_07495 [Planctomycetota bacterium]
MSRHCCLAFFISFALLAGTSSADEKFNAIVDSFVRTTGDLPSFSYEYEGMFLDAQSAQVNVTGKVTYMDGFRVVADAIVEEPSGAKRHLVRSDGATLYEVVESGGAATYLRKVNLDEIREYFGEEFLPFTVGKNPVLQVSLLALPTLAGSFYAMSFVNEYRVGSRATTAFEAQLTGPLMERAGRLGNNPLITDLTYLAGQAGRIWFYMGPDDGLIYRLEVFRRSQGMFLKADFKNYEMNVEVEKGTFLYAPPVGSKVEEFSAELAEGVRKMQRAIAGVPLKPGDKLQPVRLESATGFPVYLGAFKKAVVVIVWERMEPGAKRLDIAPLDAVVRSQVGKPIYCVIVTPRQGEAIRELTSNGIGFPVVSAGSDLGQDPAGLALRLLDASSRVIVVEPGLRVSAVIPCDNPQWVELAQKAFAEALEKVEPAAQ